MSKRKQAFDASDPSPRYHENLYRSSISDDYYENPFTLFPYATSSQNLDRNKNNMFDLQEPDEFDSLTRPSDTQLPTQASAVRNQDATNNPIPTQGLTSSSGATDDVVPVYVSLDRILQDIFTQTNCSAIPLIVLKSPNGEMPLQDVLIKLQATLRVGVSELSVASKSSVRNPAELDLINSIAKECTAVDARVQRQGEQLARFNELLETMLP